jgi:DNA-binding IclR family transcriptional regulator
MAEKGTDGEGARTVGRVLKLLELIADKRKPIRLVDIATALEMPASSAHVLAKQLVKFDYIRSDEDRRYAPSTGLVVLASKVMGGTKLISIARPFIERLSEQTGESIYLGMRTDQGIVYVDAIEGTSGLVSRTPLGSLRSAHASSAGRVFLAHGVNDADLSKFLGKAPLHAFTSNTPTDRTELRRLIDDIRKVGYAVNEQALTDKVCGVSAPIFDATAKLAGTITLSAPDTRFEPKKDLLITQVTACAEEISRANGLSDSAKR